MKQQMKAPTKAEAAPASARLQGWGSNRGGRVVHGQHALLSKGNPDSPSALPLAG